MTGLARASFCLALSLAISTGCALLTPAAVEVQKEILTTVPANFPPRQPRVATLLILAPQANAVYDTTQMAYVIRPGQIAYFSRTEWADRPSRMIHGLLVQALDKAGYFTAVVTPPFMGRFTHALQTEIVALEQDLTTEPPTFHLVLRLQLTASGNKQVIATHEVDVREALPEKTPHGGTLAANQASAKALQEVAEFVYTHVK